MSDPVDDLAAIHKRGYFVSSEDFVVERLPDGRSRITATAEAIARAVAGGPAGGGVGGPGGGGGGGPVPPGVGRCCNGGVCTVTTESACVSGGGTFYGVGTDCEPIIYHVVAYVHVYDNNVPDICCEAGPSAYPLDWSFNRCQAYFNHYMNALGNFDIGASIFYFSLRINQSGDPANSWILFMEPNCCGNTGASGSSDCGGAGTINLGSDPTGTHEITVSGDGITCGQDLIDYYGRVIITQV
jgi:hypothetical protein